MRFSFFILLVVSFCNGVAQFAPAAGQASSTAVHVESNAIVGWAVSCEVTRGWQHLQDTTLGYASYGEASDAIGAADPAVVSLGDAGSAVLTFNEPIGNRDGYDFAVFENGFSDTFLELAFVEVSSDGVQYVRFPAVSHSQTQTQIGPFGEVDTENIHHLAGKYRAQYGTPFDLEELKDSAVINIDSIVYVRIVDVVGSIDPAFGTMDSEGNMINELYPTAFESGGFDLDAVAVLDGLVLSLSDHAMDTVKHLYPNPVERGEMVTIAEAKYTIFTSLGEEVRKCSGQWLATSHMQPGLYYVVSPTHTYMLVIK